MVPVLAVLALAGCGDDDGGSSASISGTPEQQVRATLVQVTEAARAKDWDKVCGLISSDSRKLFESVSEGSCPKALGGSDDNEPEVTVAEIGRARITITGDQATADIPGDDSTVRLVREDGAWRIGSSGGSVEAQAPAPTPVQQASASDSGAKSDARNGVSVMESCFVDRNTYVGCDPKEGLPTESKAVARNVQADRYEIVSRSESGNEFRIVKEPSGMFTRTCTGSLPGCRDGTW